MRVLVVGAGAVGGYYGAALAEHGHEVAFVARGEHLAALLARGLTIRSGGRTRVLSPVRAVAKPYPGAFTSVGGRSARVLRTRIADAAAPSAHPPAIETREGRLLAQCGGGGTLEVLALEIDGALVTPSSFAASFGADRAVLGGAPP